MTAPSSDFETTSVSDLYTWGLDTNAQLGYLTRGTGMVNVIKRPKKVEFPTTISRKVAGDTSTETNGTSKLNAGERKNTDSTISSNVLAISAHDYHSVCITGCGSNSECSSGTGTTTSLSSTKIGPIVFQWGVRLGLKLQTIEYEPKFLYQFPTNTKIVRISCGKEHVVFLTSKSMVYGYGNNSYKQLHRGEVGSFAEPQQLQIHFGKPANNADIDGTACQAAAGQQSGKPVNSATVVKLATAGDANSNTATARRSSSSVNHEEALELLTRKENASGSQISDICCGKYRSCFSNGEVMAQYGVFENEGRSSSTARTTGKTEPCDAYVYFNDQVERIYSTGETTISVAKRGGVLSVWRGNGHSKRRALHFDKESMVMFDTHGHVVNNDRPTPTDKTEDWVLAKDTRIHSSKVMAKHDGDKMSLGVIDMENRFWHICMDFAKTDSLLLKQTMKNVEEMTWVTADEGLVITKPSTAVPSRLLRIGFPKSCSEIKGRKSGDLSKLEPSGGTNSMNELQQKPIVSYCETIPNVIGRPMRVSFTNDVSRVITSYDRPPLEPYVGFTLDRINTARTTEEKMRKQFLRDTDTPMPHSEYAYGNADDLHRRYPDDNYAPPVDANHGNYAVPLPGGNYDILIPDEPVAPVPGGGARLESAPLEPSDSDEDTPAAKASKNTAKKEIYSLSILCEKAIMRNLTPRIAVTVFDYALNMQLPVLWNYCLKFMHTNWNAVKNSYSSVPTRNTASTSNFDEPGDDLDVSYVRALLDEWEEKGEHLDETNELLLDILETASKGQEFTYHGNKMKSKTVEEIARYIGVEVLKDTSSSSNSPIDVGGNSGSNLQNSGNSSLQNSVIGDSILPKPKKKLSGIVKTKKSETPETVDAKIEESEDKMRDYAGADSLNAVLHESATMAMETAWLQVKHGKRKKDKTSSSHGTNGANSSLQAGLHDAAKRFVEKREAKVGSALLLADFVNAKKQKDKSAKATLNISSAKATLKETPDRLATPSKIGWSSTPADLPSDLKPRKLTEIVLEEQGAKRLKEIEKSKKSFVGTAKQTPSSKKVGSSTISNPASSSSRNANAGGSLSNSSTMAQHSLKASSQLTSNSWGYAALADQRAQPNFLAMQEVDRVEQLEDEIEEIEARFAALELAQKLDEEERLAKIYEESVNVAEKAKDVGGNRNFKGSGKKPKDGSGKSRNSKDKGSDKSKKSKDEKYHGKADKTEVDKNDNTSKKGDQKAKKRQKDSQNDWWSSSEWWSTTSDWKDWC